MKSRLLRVGATLMFTLISACGGDDETVDPTPTSTTVGFDLSKPCDLGFPQPSDLFRADDGKDESACPLPSDPIEAAIMTVIRDEGVPLDASLQMPIVGKSSIAATSVSSTNSFSLDGSSTSFAVPPLVLLRGVQGSTDAADWSVVSVSASVDGEGNVVVAPSEPLVEASYYVLVGTDELLAQDGSRLEASPETKLLVQSAPIGAGGSLDDASAARLERERLRLSAAVYWLKAGRPAIDPDRIVSIQGFSTALGFQMLARIVERYNEARTRGRIPLAVTDSGMGDLPAADFFPPNTPPQFYENIARFRRGTIAVPDILDAEGHLKEGWDSGNVPTIQMPYLISVPAGAQSFGVTVLLPGYGRSRVDAVSLANELGGGAQSGVLALDLPFHGDRSADLTDNTPNNGDPSFQGPDGIPDSSGQGFFDGDARAVRDTQIAAAIEILHVIETLRARTAFVGAGLDVDPNELHLVAHGHTAPLGLYAGAFATGLRTIQFPAGGIGVAELVRGGDAGLVSAFVEGAPSGVDASNLDRYLSRLDETVLRGVDVDAAAQATTQRFTVGTTVRLLLSHGSDSSFVSAEAQARLVASLGLPASRQSEHRPACDDFFIHPCSGLDSPAWMFGARDQIATFANSSGVSVLAPAQ